MSSLPPKKASEVTRALRKSTRQKTETSKALEAKAFEEGVQHQGSQPQGVYVNKYGHSFKKVSSISDESIPRSFPKDSKTFFNGVVESRGLKTRYLSAPRIGGHEVFQLEPGHLAYVSAETPSYGVRATRSFKKGDLIGYYGGEFRSTDFRPPNPYCLGIYKKGGLVDALHIGNELSFINDPRESFEVLNRNKANVDSSSDIYLMHDKIRTHALIAIKDIEQGEELLWSYGNGYWRDFAEHIYSAKVSAPTPSPPSAPKEYSLPDFFRKFVKPGGTLSKAQARNQFKRMCPSIFKSMFKGLSEHGTRVRFGAEFSRLMKKHYSHLAISRTADYKGIHLDFKNSPKEDEDQPIVINLPVLVQEPLKEARKREREEEVEVEESRKEPKKMEEPLKRDWEEVEEPPKNMEEPKHYYQYPYPPPPYGYTPYLAPHSFYAPPPYHQCRCNSCCNQML